MGIALAKRQHYFPLFGRSWPFDESFFDLKSELKHTEAKARVLETKDSFITEIEVPGYQREDIHLEFQKGYLKIKGHQENRDEEKLEETKVHVNERFTKKFERTFYLADYVEQDKISASLKDGLLRITLPKKADQASRKISIEKS